MRATSAECLGRSRVIRPGAGLLRQGLPHIQQELGKRISTLLPGVDVPGW